MLSLRNILFSCTFNVSLVNGNKNKLKLHCSKLNLDDSSGRAIKTLVCSRMIDGIAGSKPDESIDDHLFYLLCGCRYWPLRRADLSFRGVLSGVCVCVCVCVYLIMSNLETSTRRRTRTQMGFLCSGFRAS